MDRACGGSRNRASGEFESDGALVRKIRIGDTTISQDCDEGRDIRISSSTSTDNDEDYGEISDNTPLKAISDMMGKVAGLYLKSTQSDIQRHRCPFRTFPRPCSVIGHVELYRSRNTTSAHQEKRITGYDMLFTITISSNSKDSLPPHLITCGGQHL